MLVQIECCTFIQRQGLHKKFKRLDIKIRVSTFGKKWGYMFATSCLNFELLKVDFPFNFSSHSLYKSAFCLSVLTGRNRRGFFFFGSGGNELPWCLVTKGESYFAS